MMASSCPVLLLLVTGFLSGFLCMETLSDEDMASIDSFIQGSMAERHVPGLSLAVVTTESTLITKGYGVKDVDSGEPVTEETLFSIGSVTKGMTSLLVAKKFHEKGWSLDVPLKTVYPDFMLPDRYRTEHSCMRDLLAHRTCLDCGQLQLLAWPYSSRDDFAWRLRYCREVCPFRTKFIYNNSMYGLAGHIVATLWGHSWEDMMRMDIFDPLGMNGTTFMMRKYMDQDTLDNTAMSYVFNGTHQVSLGDLLLKPDVFPESPAGSVLSSAADMAKWLSFLLNMGKNTNGGTVVEEEVVKALFEVAMPTGEYCKNYGLGFASEQYQGQLVFAHGGHYPSYLSLLTLFPEADLGIFTSANGDQSYLSQVLIHLHLLHHLQGLGPADNRSLFGGMDDLLFSGTPRNVKDFFVGIPRTDDAPLTSSRDPRTDDAPLTSSRERQSCMTMAPGDHVYGNLLFGNLTLVVTDDGAPARLEYGENFRATLVASSDPARFRVEWTGPLKPFMDYFKCDVLFSDASVESPVPDVLILRDTGGLLLQEVKFLHHLQLEDGPIQPWHPNSC